MRPFLFLLPLAALHADEIRVAKFAGDRAAAVSFTFDDNLRDQDDFAVPLLTKHDIHATFFVIPGLTPDTNEEAGNKKVSEWGSISWQRLREIAALGHEIGSHSWTHPELKKCDDAKLEEEVRKGYEAIAEKMGTPPLTFCYPGNGVDDRVRAVALKYHIAAREKNIQRFGDWPPTNKGFTAEKANAMVDRAIEKGELLVWMIHAIANGYNALSSPDVLEDHFKYVKSRADAIWVNTFSNVTRYAMERDAAKLTQSMSFNRAVFTVEGPLDRSKFNYPLTIVIPVKNAAKVVAKRSGARVPLPVEVRKDRILVQAVPSSAQVAVSWQNDNK